MAFLGYFVGVVIGNQSGLFPGPRAVEKIDSTYKLNTTARVGVGALAADPIFFVASLAIGLLGLFSVIHGMPPAASFALISCAGFVFLTWMIVNIACSPGNGLACKLRKAAFSKHPENYLPRLI
jgi:threonine/homoserine/homoserine lactone efflux protein